MTAVIRSVVVGDVTLEIAEIGAGGRPLLLVHGFTGAKEDFGDWWDTLAQEGWHVVAPDLRGHGRSSHPVGRDAYRLDLLEADILGLIDALDWDRVVLLGHSMGGMVAQAIAIHHPERLDALILMDTVPDAPSAGVKLAFTLPIRLLGMNTVARLATKPPPRAPASVRRLYDERPGYVAFLQTKIRDSSKDMALGMMADLGRRPDQLAALRALRLPVLVLCGEHDMPGFVAGARRMADAIDGAVLQVLPGAAHNPQFETPLEWWNALSTFLDTIPSTSPPSTA